MCVTNSGNAILTPSVGSGSCVIVREVWWKGEHVLVLLLPKIQFLTQYPGSPGPTIAEVELWGGQVCKRGKRQCWCYSRLQASPSGL